MSAPRRPFRPISWWWVVFGITAVGTAIWASTWWLLAQTQGLQGAAEATARMEAIKVGLSVGAGTGGAVALLLAMRRQWLSERDQAHREQVAQQTQAHAERVAAATEHDAAERRITDLFTKAADQLGNDKAPVRLAGLYALERLAQNTPTHRQTVVNVICAYLRMPFASEPPLDPSEQDMETYTPQEKAIKVGEHTAAAAGWWQEREVRLAAQSVLLTHLATTDLTAEWPRRSAPSDPTFWPDIELDLQGATLFDFGALGRIKRADFSDALFVGGANFAHASFDGHVYFKRARFVGGSAYFYGAWFGLRAIFNDADFGAQEAYFGYATFAGMVFFDGARSEGGVAFEGARALADFNTSWGSNRRWPAGWTERSLGAGERIPRPRFGVWTGAPDEPDGDPTWKIVVKSGEALPADDSSSRAVEPASM